MKIESLKNNVKIGDVCQTEGVVNLKLESSKPEIDNAPDMDEICVKDLPRQVKRKRPNGETATFPTGKPIVPDKVAEKNALKEKTSCDHCAYKTTKESHLKRHMKARHEGVCYSCKHCEFTALQKSDIETHIKTLHQL